MILFIDIEHESGYTKPWGERLLAARTRLTYRLEDLCDDDVHLVRYHRVDAELLARLQPRAMLLSGNSSEPEAYPAGSRDALHGCIRSSGLPVFGFCGGHQVIGNAFGVELERIGPDADSESGWIVERGDLPVTHEREHRLLDDIAPDALYRHAHSWQLSELPDGFVRLASTDTSPIQMMVNDDLRIVGTQFHPEYWSDRRPAGETMIGNFIRWADL